MTDINQQTRPPLHAPRPSEAAASAPADRRDALISCIELFFFAYRDFTGEPDAVLEEYGFGRAHHRVLHFVHRNPGIRVADLLAILKITKQSLARVLKQLVDEGFIAQRTGADDRRERHLKVTAKGAKLASRLAELQIRRIETALAKAGPAGEGAARDFLLAMIAAEDQPAVRSLLRIGAGGNPGATAGTTGGDPAKGQLP